MRNKLYWYWILGLAIFIAAAALLIWRQPHTPPQPPPGALEVHWQPSLNRRVGIDEPFTLTLPLPATSGQIRSALTLNVSTPWRLRALGHNRYRILPRHFWPQDTLIVAQLNLPRLFPRLSSSVRTSSDHMSTDDGRIIDVNLTHQMMTIYEAHHLVRTMAVSTGVFPNHTTPTGTFWIWRRVADDHMQGGTPGTPGYYNLPHVPWAQYIVGGVAIHGAYWNRRFGVPRSHGCIQLATRTFNPHPQGISENAGWLWHFAHLGTPVIVSGTTPEQPDRLLSYPPPPPVRHFASTV